MTQYNNLDNWTIEKLKNRLDKKYNTVNRKHKELEEAISDEEPLDEYSIFKQLDDLSNQINELEIAISKR